MNRFITYSILVGLLFLYACEKPVPENEEELTAVFFVKGSLNGTDINIKAGDDNVYMYPSFESDTLNIKSFVGRIGDIGCVDKDVCPGSVRISIREKVREQNQVRPISENLYVSKYTLRGPAEYLFNSYKATFTSKSSPAGAVHFYDFGDGITSDEENPTHIYLREHDSIVNPVLQVSSGSGCSNSLSYKLEFKQPCSVDFFPFLNNGILSWSTSPNHNRKELWDLEHGYLPLGAGNLPPLDSVFTACIKSEDTINGCVSYKCKNIVLDTSVVECVANFDVVKEEIVIKDVRDYSQVSIQWVSNDGKVYDSELYKQPALSWFEITAVDAYLNYRNESLTKKLTIAFSLRLYGTDENDFIDFESEKSVIAISYQ